MRVCSIDQCSNKHHARGWCSKHYMRWRKFGDVEGGNPNYNSAEESFIARTEWQGDCLLWTGHVDKNGYGRIWAEGKHQKAHRYAWEREHGTIPEGMLVDHKDHCNPACCNTKHLRLATKSQNGYNRSGATRKSKTGYRNVIQNKGNKKYQVVVNGIYFGTFTDIKEAAKVAEETRKELFGEYAGRG